MCDGGCAGMPYTQHYARGCLIYLPQAELVASSGLCQSICFAVGLIELRCLFKSMSRDKVDAAPQSLVNIEGFQKHTTRG